MIKVGPWLKIVISKMKMHQVKGKNFEVQKDKGQSTKPPTRMGNSLTAITLRRVVTYVSSDFTLFSNSKFDVRSYVTSTVNETLEEICLKCDYVMAGVLSGIMSDHVSDFSTVSVRSLVFYVKELQCYTPSKDKVQI